MKRLRHLLAFATPSLAPAGFVNSSAAPESTFTLLDGSSLTTSDIKGKVALSNFWATGWTTRLAGMPMLSSTYEKFRGRGYETFAVAMIYGPPPMSSTSPKNAGCRPL